MRTGLNPLLAEFRCGNITTHHAQGDFQGHEQLGASDWMYAGAGAADITNWCRAALVIDSTDNPRVFRFIAAKRAARIGWANDLTGEREDVRYFPTAAELEPWLFALEKSPPGGCLIIAIDSSGQPEFSKRGVGCLLENREGRLSGEQFFRPTASGQKAGQSLTTEIPLS